MRYHWRELDFWRWWWRNRVPFLVKSVLAVLVLAGIVVGGWFAAQSLPSAKADDSGAATVVRTVRRVVTVREGGKVVVRRVRQVRTVFVANPAAPTKTIHDTRTVDAARTVVRTVGGVRTVVRTVAAPTAKAAAPRVRTVTRTVVHTVTRTKTVPKVVDRVITIIEQQKPVTVTVTVTTPSP